MDFWGDFFFFKSYLKNRNSFVSVGYHTSELAKMLHGVPQGSNLGPFVQHLHAPTSSDHGKIAKYVTIIVQMTQKFTIQYHQVTIVPYNMSKCIKYIKDYVYILCFFFPQLFKYFQLSSY